MKVLWFALVLVVLSSFSFILNAQVSDSSLINMSLEDLLNVKIDIGTKSNLSVREIPGIITVISQEEIENSGARDIIDVLRQVPGIEFGAEIDGIIGMGVRGLWGIDGKCLMLYDGIAMDENLFDDISFEDRLPLSMIKSIEIIRGPGSVIYGGNAAYIVINIITKTAEDLNGVLMSGKYGRTQKINSNRNLTFAYGKVFGDFSVVASSYFGNGLRSDRRFNDVHGTGFDMTDNSQTIPGLFDLKLSYKNLKVQFFSENDRHYARDQYDSIRTKKALSQFITNEVNIDYKYQLTDNIEIEPQFKYNNQEPWKTFVDDVAEYHKDVTRYTYELTSKYSIDDKQNILFGLGYYSDYARSFDLTSTGGYFGENSDQENISYHNIYVYGQGLFQTPLGIATIGARYEKHNQYGSAFVPRFALTKIIDRFHFKLLASRAFRAPAVEDIQLFPVRPELTTIFETEIGYQFNDEIYATVNFFDITVNDAIVFSAYVKPDGTIVNTFNNYKKTGSKGIESTLKGIYDWGSFDVSYSYYNSKGKNSVDLFEVPGDPNSLQGFANHKINFNGTYKITSSIFFNTTGSYLSQRSGITSAILIGQDSQGKNMYDPVFTKIKPSLLLNTFINWKNIANITGLMVGAGIYNLLNDDYVFVMPYSGSHAPTPSKSREFIANISYKFEF